MGESAISLKGNENGENPESAHVGLPETSMGTGIGGKNEFPDGPEIEESAISN